MFNAPMYFISTGSSGGAQRGTQCRLTDLTECFFISHPDSCTKEGEESKRVLYFHPTTENIDKQTEITGFAEAVLNFTDNFVTVPTRQRAANAAELPYRDVVTAKTVQVYIMVENAEFMIGVILNKKACNDMDYTIFTPSIRAVLRDAHAMFRLFFGHLSHFYRDNKDSFKDRLDYFFSRYLSLLRVYQMPLLDYFPGVQFLPLDGNVFTNIDAFATELIEQVPQISKVLFLYQDKLIYYTICKKDLLPVFRYLTQNLLPMSLRSELEPHALTTRSSGQQGKFLTGPSEICTDEAIGGEDALPTVFLREQEDSERLTPYHLMAYRSLNATVVMLVKDEVSRYLMRSIEAVLSVEVPPLASSIGESSSKQPSIGLETDFHFVYFNPSSLSLRTSFLEHPPSANSPPTVPPSVHKIACDSFARLLDDSSAEFGECCVKTDTEWWIFIKKATQRCLVLLIPPSNLNTLPDVQGRVQTIIKTYFQSIFLV